MSDGLRPGDRCECGLMIGHGELFHRDSPAHLKRMMEKATTTASPPIYVDPDRIIDTPQKGRGMWSRLLDLILGEPVPPERAFPDK